MHKSEGTEPCGWMVRTSVSEKADGPYDRKTGSSNGDSTPLRTEGQVAGEWGNERHRTVGIGNRVRTEEMNSTSCHPRMAHRHWGAEPENVSKVCLERKGQRQDMEGVHIHLPPVKELNAFIPWPQCPRRHTLLILVVTIPSLHATGAQ